MPGLRRHIEAVRNVTLPGGRLAFRLGDEGVGWVTPEAAHAIVQTGLPCRPEDEAIALPEAAGLPALVETLAARGAFPRRHEAFDVRAQPGGPVLTTADRGALPWFGLMAEGVHVNGLVHRRDGLHVWVASRAADRPIDPGKLDNLFAGGIASGFDADQTLRKEGAEEAGIPDALAARAQPVGVISYTMLRPEGLRRDRLHCYDLSLPEDFVPHPEDGEIESFALWPAAEVLQQLRQTDDFKFNVALVVIDLLLRHGLVPPDDPETRRLHEGIRQGG